MSGVSATEAAVLIEVAPRDGFQPIGPFIPTAEKVGFVRAAHAAGLRGFDTAFGGLGGCPFASGATGNTATKEAVRMFRRMGVETGVDLDALVRLALRAAALAASSAA